MKYNIVISLFLSLLFSSAFSQTAIEKREIRKNTTVKEWNTEGNRRWMDHLTVYNADGLKIEEIEFAVYGQRERIVFEYNDQALCVKEVVYDYRNKPYRIRKYEYHENGTKKKQYNYLPNGKLYSTKVFEYLLTD
jgi:hypothetical protein